MALIINNSLQNVWGHPDYPEVVFKIDRKEDALKQERIALKTKQAIEEIEDAWVHVPQAYSIPLETFAVYVEECLLLSLNYSQHEEFWARIITYYQSPECSDLFKSNLTSLISQISIYFKAAGHNYKLE